MYAGMLNKKHRIEMLIKGFMLTKGDYELWLFGSGDFEREIQEYAKNDKRIKFFGRVNRNVVLEYEHRASLLVNIRDSKEEYTKFSFPSKTIEYMACGTPLLTTKLPGIPDEYYEYCYTLDDETVDGVNKSLENILSLPQDELLTKGKEAMNFIFSNKIAGIQGNKIIEFLSVNRGDCMKILQINSVCGSGSTGKIAVQISDYLDSLDIENYIAYGIGNSNRHNTYKIGNGIDNHLHSFISRKLCLQGYGSIFSTIKFVGYIKRLNPDIIHLHNIHGHYLNFPILFNHLKKSNVNVVWTFHDCWPFTGKCAHFTKSKCYKWKTHCQNCKQLNTYPDSIRDRTFKNFNDKKEYFTSIDKFHIVTVSNWLKDTVENSFFKEKDIKCIYNGIDTNVFKPVQSSLRKK